MVLLDHLYKGFYLITSILNSPLVNIFVNSKTKQRLYISNLIRLRFRDFIDDFFPLFLLFVFSCFKVSLKAVVIGRLLRSVTWSLHGLSDRPRCLSFHLTHCPLFVEVVFPSTFLNTTSLPRQSFLPPYSSESVC